MKNYQSSSSAETKRFGKKLAESFAERKSRRARSKHALVIALMGELGSGKTTFVQGFLLGFGVRSGGSSPTFILIKRYAVRHKLFADIYHVDAYRIRKPKEFLALGFRKILDDKKNIVLVEWAERVKKILPKKIIELRFGHGHNKDQRTIEIR